MAPKRKQPQKKRKVRFAVSSEFGDAYRKFLAVDPSIREQLTLFNKNKRMIPPTPLPTQFQDHTLKGVLDGIRECHLAHDILLLYTHADDLVHLLLVCDHRELKGRRGQAISRRVKPLTKRDNENNA